MAASGDPNLNALWCRAIAEELARGGCAGVVLCPGSRNSPLLFALKAVFGDRVRVHAEERSAGFIALGWAVAARTPVAVCVTSGSAAANLWPAMAEAALAGVPLLALTANRPWEAQDCGAPQAMPQAGMFAALAVVATVLGEPLATPPVLRAVRARITRLVQTAAAESRPAHVEIPLREPLAPLPDPAFSATGIDADALHGRADGAPWVRVAAGASCTEAGAVEALLRPGLRGVLVVGPRCPLAPAAVAALAEATGWPVVADAPSGLRRPACPGLVAGADALLAGPLAAEKPDLVLLLGAPPLARAAFEWLDRRRCPVVAVDDRPGDADFLHRVAHQVVRPHADLLARWTRLAAPGDAAWAERWRAASRRAEDVLAGWRGTAGWSAPLAAARACAHPGFDRLHLASSMAVRYANLLLAGAPPAQSVTANRGVNGIDGTLGTFLGLLAGGGRGLCLCGDLAALHDLPALAAARGARGAVVVLNDDGGGIFAHLAVAQAPGWQELVRTPHGLDFAGAAAQYRLPYQRCADAAALQAALDRAAVAEAMTLIECDLRGVDSTAAWKGLLGVLRGG